MVGALGGVVLGFAFLRRRSALGIAAAVLALGAFALLACGRPGDHRPLHDARRRRSWRSSSPSRLLGWRLLEPGHPWRRRWQVFAGLVALMFVALAAEPVGPRLAASTPTSPTRRGSRATSPTWSTPAPSSRSAARSPSPTTAPSPASPSASTSSRPQIVSASEEGIPGRGYFVAPASPFVIHNFILDPNDPTRFSLDGPARASAKSPATSPGSSTAAAELEPSLDRARPRRGSRRRGRGRRGRPAAAARRGGRRRGRAGRAARASASRGRGRRGCGRR